MIEAWLTQYALSTGIKKVQGTVTGNMLSYSEFSNGVQMLYAHGKDWHTTKESAIARAEEMRTGKIKSLRKAIEKLEGMTFND